MIFLWQELANLFFESELAGNFDGFNQDRLSGSFRHDFQKRLRDLGITCGNAM